MEQYHVSDNISEEEEDGLSNDELNEKTAAEALGLDELTDGLCYNGKRYEELQFEDLKGILFRSVEEVERFYAYYAIAKGFSVRKSKSNRNRADVISRRELVCSKEGTRDAPPPKKKQRGANLVGSSNSQVNNVVQYAGYKRKVKETRCGCPARLVVLRCKKTGHYYVSIFITDHNHALRREMDHSKSNRSVGDHSISHVPSVKKISIPSCRAYELLVHQAGGFQYVGFTLNDLYIELDGERSEILVDGDAQAAISFMNLRASHDPHFYGYFCVDREGRLANIFWRDSKCLTDYNNFGDVLIMDSTYKTNIYGKPFVLFVGVNNHRATVLFGCALLVDETEETYKWVVSTFLSSMNGKRPISVITDQDDAMRNAVVYCIPEATHRLCAWHISKNVTGKIHDVNVQKYFFHLIYAGLSVDEWETSWNLMVVMNGLQNNPWVTGMYNKRHRWAEAFFRGKFFGGVCGTQRCEGMHRILRVGLGKSMWLYEVLPRLDKSMDQIRERVLFDDFTSIGTSPVIGTHLRALQEQLGKIFTHDIFLLLQDQIGFESSFFIEEQSNYPEMGYTVVTLTQYAKPERKWNVTYQNNNDKPILSCTCQLFESDGIPCCHIFGVMKAKHITLFPDSLVRKRWTKEAFSLSRDIRQGQESIPNHSIRVARYCEMMEECAQVCFRASFSKDAYDETIDAMRRMSIGARRFPVQPLQEDATDNLVDRLHRNVVKNPNISTSKGTQSRPSSTEFESSVGGENGRGGSHSNGNKLLHHNEEARDFSFFGGYDSPPLSSIPTSFGLHFQSS